MPRSRALRNGVGARCSVLVRYLHPSNKVAERFPNAIASDRINDLTVLRREEKSRNGRTYQGIVFATPSIPNEEVWCAQRYCRVLDQGPPDDFFDDARPSPPSPEVAAAASAQDGVPIDDSIFHAGNTAEDIAVVENQGFDVDDDNRPAEENVPVPNGPTADPNDGLYPGQKWGWDGIDYRKVNVPKDNEPGFVGDWNLWGKTWLDVFLFLFPRKWMEDVLLAETSKALQEEKAPELTFGELLRYIGLWLLMATCAGFNHDEFWSGRKRDERTRPCPYNFRQFMSHRRFDAITRCLRFTSAKAPSYPDRIWEVRQMISEWNWNMARSFVPGWILCLDESMSIWFNRWTCPGWVFCPRKPHPFGNEYHTACCGLTGILFSLELVEGKDRPRGRAPANYDDLGKTVGLLLRLLEPVFNTGRYVVLDSGFCVLKALVELRRNGVYACALIKKRRYWPTLVPGDAMERHFRSKDVGDVDAIAGQMRADDGVDVEYTLWGMKEPDYVMRMMATGGALRSDNTCRETSRRVGGETVRFSYTLPYEWHFKYRHAVDDHNNLRHALPSLEDTWNTMRWAIRVFAFLLAVTEVNTYLALRSTLLAGALGGKIPKFHVFRRKLAWLFIDNPWMPLEEDAEEVAVGGGECHDVGTAPPYATRFEAGKWICDAKQRHQQYVCRWPQCPKKTRNYCACNPSRWLCTSHVVRHAMDAAVDAYAQN